MRNPNEEVCILLPAEARESLALFLRGRDKPEAIETLLWGQLLIAGAAALPAVDLRTLVDCFDIAVLDVIRWPSIPADG